MGYSPEMPTFRTQVTIATADNLNANFATNTWHCIAPDLTELALWHAALTTFYTAIDTQMSNLVLGTNGLRMKSYDLADPEPRAPVLTAQSNLTTGSAPMPTEVSLVMSFQAAQSSGVPQSRRRNRVYLPFIIQSANGTDARPNVTIINTVQAAAAALLAASGPSSGDWQWVVYSPTDSAFDLVDNGWIDNEWDTQRRRGRLATSRTTF